MTGLRALVRLSNGFGFTPVKLDGDLVSIGEEINKFLIVIVLFSNIRVVVELMGVP